MSRANTLGTRRLSTKKPPRAAAGGTVERILDAALLLLNQEGGAAVTTNHIAAHLGMSPGNLYYHFRNREEIIRAIFPRIVAGGLEATAKAADEVSARELGERHVLGLEVLWRYRFFYRDLNALLARDPVLMREYGEYYERLSAQYLELFETLVAQKSLHRPAAAADLRRLVTASLLVWFNWLPFLATLRPMREVDRADVAEGALHSFLVVEPHLEAGFAAAARKVIERHRRRR